MTGVTTLPFCTVCGRQLSETARYCPACGNPTSEPDEIESFDQELDAAVTVLERLTNAPGAIVLMENPAKKRARRLEVTVDQGGLMSYQDRLLILSLLAELFAWDAYLHAEVAHGATVVSCVWHVIGGDIIPLTAGHASAVLSVYEDLSGQATSADFPERTADAPALINDIEPVS